MKNIKFIILTFIIPFASYGQDTLKVMQYNLLNYGNTSMCPTPTMANKDAYLLTIVNHVNPHVLCVNEMANNEVYANRILANVMNKNGRTSFQRATYTNNANSSLVNMLFYDSNILGIKSEHVISSSYRDINVYKMYYKQSNLNVVQDTVFIHFIVAHLKAGSTSNDAIDRATMTTAVMNYLNGINKADNYMMMGDLNVYTSSETCFQNLVNHSNTKIRFYDPVNQLGAWSSNNTYKNVHTQSTQVTVSGTCHSSGGTDDRFDFILCSKYIMGDSANVKYVPNSYITVGQDGLRYNQSAVSPTNTQVSSTIASAIYNMSDHYPVALKLKLTPKSLNSISINDDAKGKINKIVFENPVDEFLTIFKPTDLVNIKVTISSIIGQTVYSTLINETTNSISLDISTVSKGLYLINFEDEKGNISTKKITIN